MGGRYQRMIKASAALFCELISLWVAHSSQITQNDGSIQMALFIIITMMVRPQQSSRLMKQAEIPVTGCCSGYILAWRRCFFILLPWFGIIRPGLVLHSPSSLQDINLSLDLIVWWISRRTWTQIQNRKYNLVLNAKHLLLYAGDRWLSECCHIITLINSLLFSLWLLNISSAAE